MNSPHVRNPDVDAVRGIAIVLVVLGHINRGILDGRAGAWSEGLKTLDFILYSVHMPAFFYLAGFFTYQSLARHSRKSYLTSRWPNIVYPYVFWSIATVVIHFVMSQIAHINHPVPPRALLSIGWAPINVLWFLYALFLMQVSATAFSRHPKVFLLISLAAASVASSLPWVFGSGIAMKTLAHLPFFAIGFALSSTGSAAIPSALLRKRFAVSAFIVWIFACVLARRYGADNPIVIATLPICLIGLIALGSSASIVARAGPKVFGRHIVSIGLVSLPIYLLHSFSLALVPRMLTAIGAHSTVAEMALGVVVGVYGSWGVFLLLRHANLDGLVGLTPRKVPAFTRGDRR